MRLEEIRERWKQATPGPWAIRYINRRPINIVTLSEQVAARSVIDTAFTSKNDPLRWSRDSDFIAHSWEDVAYLLAELERQPVVVSEPSKEPVVQEDVNAGLVTALNKCVAVLEVFWAWCEAGPDLRPRPKLPPGIDAVNAIYFAEAALETAGVKATHGKRAPAGV